MKGNNAMSERTNAPDPLRALSAAEARAQLAEEVAAGTGAGEGRKAKALALSAIETVECLFQPREIAEHHVTSMVKDVKAGACLPPLLVYWTGARAVLLDGHHRKEAYRRAKHPAALPVEWFTGSLDEAIAEAVARNCQEKLPMTGPQRANAAWKLVTFNGLSKAQIARSTAVSERQVAVMRQARKALEEAQAGDAENYRTWREAREAVRGSGGWTMMTTDEREARMEAQAREWTRRMGKAVGTAFANNPEIAAMALADLLGRKLPDVIGFLRQHISKDDLEEEEVEGDFLSDF
jgi:hypothetical protein